MYKIAERERERADAAGKLGFKWNFFYKSSISESKREDIFPLQVILESSLEILALEVLS